MIVFYEVKFFYLYTNRKSCNCRCQRARVSCSYPAYGEQGRQGRRWCSVGGKGRGPAAGGRDSPRTATAPSAQRRSSSVRRAWPGAPSEMEFLDINLRKDSSLLLHAIHSVSTDGFSKENQTLLCTTSKKNLRNEKYHFVETRVEN
jgi:hypothetical protein